MDVLTLIVPCYNEANAIAHFVERLSACLPEVSKRFGVTFQTIFVDDGSRDGTGDILGEMEFEWPSKLLVLSRNFGKEAALTAGLEAATGDAVILMDADLQHPPERIADLVEHWRNGSDVVYFFKRERDGEGIGKQVGSRLYYWLVNLGGRFTIPPNAGDFRLMDRKVVDALRRLPERERLMKGLFGWVGFQQKGLPFDVPDRHGNAGSRFSSARLIGLALDGLTSFSIVPIRLIAIFGFAISALSVLYMLYVIAERIFLGSPFSGFASIIVLISFFGGVQLVCLGIIGEYVGKTLVEAKQRPNYILRENVTLADRKPKTELELASPEGEVDAALRHG